MIDPVQSKMARAALGWSIRDLAQKAGVGVATVTRFENGQVTPTRNNLSAIRDALEQAGIEFIDEKGRGLGVMLTSVAEVAGGSDR